MTSVLIQLAELAQLRGDYASQVASLDEAAALGQELGAWGDLSYIDGMLATARLRSGDLERARSDLERAEGLAAERSPSLNDMGAWLTLVRAELHWQEGDLAAAARNCEKVLAWLDGKQSSWWDGMRALLQARLAMVFLREGDEVGCRGLLARALGTAAEWVELPSLAAVIDAIAVFSLQAGGGPGEPVDRAAAAATLLGVAHTIRGAFDEGSLDAPAVRESARSMLGEAEFTAAYERGRALDRGEAVAAAQGALAG
jgi:tetratricopeptide (TPR) repeat protein